jgi:hypothetical protein
MNTNTQVENAVVNFFNSDKDLDEANEKLREEITTLKEARYAVAFTIQEGFDDEEIEDLREVLLSI